MATVYHQLKDVVNKALHVPPSSIRLRQTLDEDLRMTKWEKDLLANYVERSFNINLPESAFQETRTVKEVVIYIENKLGHVLYNE